jgi:hypothetical protein
MLKATTLNIRFLVGIVLLTIPFAKITVAWTFNGNLPMKPQQKIGESSDGLSRRHMFSLVPQGLAVGALTLIQGNEPSFAEEVQLEPPQTVVIGDAKKVGPNRLLFLLHSFSGRAFELRAAESVQKCKLIDLCFFVAFQRWKSVRTECKSQTKVIISCTPEISDVHPSSHPINVKWHSLCRVFQRVTLVLPKGSI